MPKNTFAAPGWYPGNGGKASAHTVDSSPAGAIPATSKERPAYPWLTTPKAPTAPPAPRPWDRPATPPPAPPAPMAHPSPESPAAAWAAYWAGLGLALVPIPPGEKGPRMSGWPERPMEPDYWLTHTTEGMGALLGRSGLLSFDGDHIPEAGLAFAAVGIELDALKAGAVIIQGAPDRWRAMFRLPPGAEGLSRRVLTWPAREPEGKSLTVFELRAGPIQDCLPPTVHPGTGKPYALMVAPWELEEWTAPPPVLLELWRDWDHWRPILEAACPWAPAKPEPEAKAPPRERAGGESVISAFNAAHDPAAILAAHGYIPKGPNLWLSPSSGSGIAGIRRLSQTGRIYSHHTSDPLHGAAHDAFSMFTVLEHNGDTRAAVKAVARLLGIALPDRRQAEVCAEAGPPPHPEAWPKPLPLAATFAPEPYPLDALPEPILAAVDEALACTQAPVPLVASAALSALSLAGQHLANVRRAAKLAGPCSLYFLTVNDSGERKTSAEGLFLASIRAWEREQAAAMAPLVKAYESELAAWEAEKHGIRERIKSASKAGKSAAEARQALLQHAAFMPLAPQVPRLLYQDVTAEALAWSLATVWPSGAIASSEAGAVFGSHAMSKDSITRSLSLLNQLWDAAGPLAVDRRTSESFKVQSARVSLSLMIQELTLHDFLERAGALARGSGFLARFLLAWPESTQGTRFYADPPAGTPALTAYNARLSALLSYPLPMSEDNHLEPPELPLSPEAHQAWVAFHDLIEGKLGEGGELRQVRDVASKTADNAARLACLFHLYEHGPSGEIGQDHFYRAACLVAWHLNESRRFFGEVALPMELADAARLDRWLVEYARREQTLSLPTRDAQRLGPVRVKERLSEALATLAEVDRARVVQESRRKVIYLNPAIVAEVAA